MSTLRDPELSDSLELAADVLRSLAERWRARIHAGRLAEHPVDEVEVMVERMERAIEALVGDEAAPRPRRPPPPSLAGDERFRQLGDSVRDYAIVLLDEGGHIQTWNAGAERINGYRAEEVIGRHVSLFHRPEDVAAGRTQQELDTAAREGRYIEEGWRVRKDGTRFWSHVTVTALRDLDGRLTGFAKVIRDVTELRSATEALRQSEERLRLMIETVRDYAIFMLDPTGHIASWNVGAERLKGYRADEIIGRHFSTFYLPSDRERRHPEYELERAIADGRYEEEGWRVRKDGSRFWANVVITAVFDAEGRHLGFTKVTRDFTEARRLREAQLALQLRDDFLSIAGHELRTPLTALLMQVQGLARTAGDDEPLKRRLQKASAAGLRLEKLISQMLDVSCITAGRLVLAEEKLRLDALVREVVDRLADAAEAAQCPLTLDLAPVEGSWDRLRLEQVVTNLLTNALKYGRNRPVRVALASEAGAAVLRVSDEGIGIPPADQRRIFDRFERATGTRDYGGFGLGLWISRSIVEACGGSIAVASEPGHGATFTVRLPLGAACSEPARSTTSESRTAEDGSGTAHGTTAA